MPKTHHDCPESCDDATAGDIHLGVAGVLATLKVERCDGCERFPSDAAARRYLRRLLAYAEETVELLDDVTGALEVVLISYGSWMANGDKQARRSLVKQGHDLVELLRKGRA